MAITLRVTPEILRQKSGEFTTIITDIERRFRTIEDISDRTRGYWNGEAGDRDRQGYDSFQDDITYIVNRLREHPTDLLTMAGIYQQAERQVVQVDASLKTAGIV